MENSKTSVTIGGTSFLNLLFLTFLVLKLTKVIEWSWWWVTAPLWMPVAVALGIAFIVLVFGIITSLVVDRNKTW